MTPLTASLAFLAGIAMAAAALAYSADGRINVVQVWLLWAALPLAGSLVAAISSVRGRRRPWLFRWRQQQVQWHPSAVERLRMALLLQVWWMIAALGLLAGFLFLLMFSDLAFGWRSTLMQGVETMYRLTTGISLPWQRIWPDAQPSPALIEATRFFRIQPQSVNPGLAGAWWSFLFASVIFYNLLPRLVLAAVLGWRLHRLSRQAVKVRGETVVSDAGNAGIPVSDQPLSWQQAPVISWELNDSDALSAALRLGNGSWQDDEQQLRAWLQHAATELVWQVNAERSPVAELGDLMAMAREHGVVRQALHAAVGPHTDIDRHIASWRLFAARQGVIWLEDTGDA